MDDEELSASGSCRCGWGRVYASGRTSLLGTDGVSRVDFGLADVFGVHFAGTEDGWGVYLRAREQRLLEAMHPEEYLGYGFPPTNDYSEDNVGLAMPRLTTSYEGTVLATLNLPFAYPSPGSRGAHDFASIHSSPPWQDVENPTIVEHCFGTGKCVYSVVPIETDKTESGNGTFAFSWPTSLADRLPSRGTRLQKSGSRPLTSLSTHVSSSARFVTSVTPVQNLSPSTSLIACRPTGAAKHSALPSPGLSCR